MKEVFCLFCFAFRIKETQNVSRQRESLKMQKECEIEDLKGGGKGEIMNSRGRMKEGRSIL